VSNLPEEFQNLFNSLFIPKPDREDDLSIQLTAQSQADAEVNRKLKKAKEMSEIKLKEEKERDERIRSRVLFYLF
jgi:hypothetical protein